MSVDVIDLIAFYDSPLGDVARRMVARRLAQRWGDVSGFRLLGLGYAAPYLPQEGCERVLAFMPAAQGVTHWPDRANSASALVDPLVLPLAEGSVDRVLAIHAIEAASDPAELLHEIARVLTPEGRVMLAFPNRRGLWARMDSTPFGHGQPFSRKQMRRLLQATQLEAENWQETLYMPPLGNNLVLPSAPVWERLGQSLSLPFAGLYLVEAVKRVQKPIPIRSRRRRPVRNPVLVPVPASRSHV